MANYQLLTCTRYDPALTQWEWNNSNGKPCPVFLPGLHHDRLKSAARIHDWPYAIAAIDKLNLAQACIEHIEERERSKGHAYKMRITVSQAGVVEITESVLPSNFTEDPMRQLSVQNSDARPIQVFIDIEATEPSLFTRTKATRRVEYSTAKQRNKAALDRITPTTDTDILLYNTDGQVMETMIYNIAFYRNSRWITPSTSSGCLPGVLRRWLLDIGRIFEDEDGSLTKSSIEVGEHVLLFNGVQGCRLGVFQQRP